MKKIHHFGALSGDVAATAIEKKRQALRREKPGVQ
jgi:hypothetical protein